MRDYFTKSRFNPAGKKQVAPKSANQRKYIQAIQEKDVVFGIGVAGTGKTYLAVAMAVQALMQKQVNRIVLARPAVEAGEKLGFLPGDLQDKVDPYLRPLYDALFDLIDYERVTRLLEKRVIEVAPLAFMRGRTLSDAFIILDEAQNTTSEQMKMFLTRIGFSSKAVITGDVTQVDLPVGKRSGLIERGIPWLGDPSLVIYALIVVAVWRLLPFGSLVISAAVQGIPNSYLEAATIDGANGWQKFRYIVLPELTYSLTVVGILALIWNMNDLITVWGATQGGPADASQILSTWIYSVGFTSFRFGLSSALSVINFTLLLIASIAYLLVLRRTWGVKER